MTGPPWAAAWGSDLADVRAVTGSGRGPIDWTIGGKPAHEEHGGMTMPAATPRSSELTRVVAAARTLRLAPVKIAPPASAGAPRSITSAAADRPQRSDVRVDGATGQILGRVDFTQRHWIDRAVGIGVAAHEGALFGLADQLLNAPCPAGRARFGAMMAAGIVLPGVPLPLFGLTLAAVLLFDRGVTRTLPRAARWLGLAPPAVAG